MENLDQKERQTHTRVKEGWLRNEIITHTFEYDPQDFKLEEISNQEGLKTVKYSLDKFEIKPKIEYKLRKPKEIIKTTINKFSKFIFWTILLILGLFSQNVLIIILVLFIPIAYFGIKWIKSEYGE